ncbi:Uncharacterized protein conserved in bacteria [Moraxella atlantae]|uniref:Uncharacterized protein conserved in bacteria n=2 Tax=Faucicola atlantae TaxID=34059 RepID=A0A378QLS0_9GAMM|nr:Uncharacterized protein conserved in bacteria [Moraxella atlantae]
MKYMTEHDYQELRKIAIAEPHDLSYLWDWVQDPNVGYVNQNLLFTFKERREAFFEVLERLMVDKVLFLEKDGIFLQGSIKQQIDLFRKSFPNSEEEILSIGGMFVWFVLPSCPAYAVWKQIKKNGEFEYYWSQ